MWHEVAWKGLEKKALCPLSIVWDGKGWRSPGDGWLSGDGWPQPAGIPLLHGISDKILSFDLSPIRSLIFVVQLLFYFMPTECSMENQAGCKGKSIVGTTTTGWDKGGGGDLLGLFNGPYLSGFTFQYNEVQGMMCERYWPSQRLIYTYRFDPDFLTFMGNFAKLRPRGTHEVVGSFYGK
ncbi:uncharacterized protein LOC124691674 [Lolium rigidum]|uniref:uncharacterized protein LOC124691674 n=1 Tax=Lolium rigidum TaxID=89674 RepID=UPI001F5E32AB|nr:uncharacterized protein LOC124691674 [Lolium rigidum]